MKNFSTQCVTLMMIIVMVYAAPTSDPCKYKRLQLEQIKEAATNALKHNLPNNSYVCKITGYQKKCMENVFCLAYKALKKVKITNTYEHLQRLKIILDEYSKNETCHLGQCDQYSVKTFLEDIKICAIYALNNKNICHK